MTWCRRGAMSRIYVCICLVSISLSIARSAPTLHKDIQKRSAKESVADDARVALAHSVEKRDVGRSREGVRDGASSDTASAAQLHQALEELRTLGKQSKGQGQTEGDMSDTSSQGLPRKAGDSDADTARLLAYISEYLHRSRDSAGQSHPSSAAGHNNQDIITALRNIKLRIHDLASSDAVSSRTGSVATRSMPLETDGYYHDMRRRGTFGPYGRELAPITARDDSDDGDEMGKLSAILNDIRKRKFSNIPGKRKLHNIPGKRDQPVMGREVAGDDVLSVLYDLTDAVERLTQREAADRKEERLLSSLVQELSALHPSRK